jgi:anthranilate phosphoribosyltransferase
MMFAALVEKLHQRRDLTAAEAGAAMAAIMEGLATPAQMAGLLVALSMKGERPDEIVGLARTMRAHAIPLPGRIEPVFDTCGTGGDRSGSFNVSSLVALVLAACGVKVAKHGNRSVSSQCGSADVFEALGVNVAAPPALVQRSLEMAGIGFLFAPTFHPSMRHAAPARRELGVRTAFNLLGPLTNPAGAARQLVGVPRPELTELVARALLLLGSERAWVVHAADGLDEISTTGYTKVSECRDGTVNTFYVHPSEYGVPKGSLGALRGGDARTNAEIARRVLAGERGPARDIVLLNAGAGLFIASRCQSIREGIEAAAAAVDRGDAERTLEAMIVASAGHGNAGDGADPTGWPRASGAENRS